MTLSLGAGSHSVFVQWKRWGSWVRQWTSNPSALDGFAAGRTLTASAEYLTLQLASPLSQGVLQQSDTWVDVPGMALAVSYDPNAPSEPIIVGKSSDTFLFTYVLHVRPNAAPGADPLKAKDVLSTRIVVDSTPYRESSAHFRTVTRAFSSGVLFGSASVQLSAGNHTARLQWRKSGLGSVRAWWTQPNFLDGFVTSRSIAALRDRMPNSRAVSFSGFPGDGQTGAISGASSVSPDIWRQVRGGLLPLSLPKTTYLRLSYSVSMSRYG